MKTVCPGTSENLKVSLELPRGPLSARAPWLPHSTWAVRAAERKTRPSRSRKRHGATGALRQRCRSPGAPSDISIAQECVHVSLDSASLQRAAGHAGGRAWRDWLSSAKSAWGASSPFHSSNKVASGSPDAGVPTTRAFLMTMTKTVRERRPWGTEVGRGGILHPGRLPGTHGVPVPAQARRANSSNALTRKGAARGEGHSSRTFHTLEAWSWVSHLPSLRIGLPLGKTGIMTVTIPGGFCRDCMNQYD